MHILHTLEENCWRYFLESQSTSNIFHTPEMFQVFSLAKGHRPELWVVTDDSGQPLSLLLPVQVTVIDGLLRRLSTRSIAYGSVLCTHDSAGMEALGELLDKYNLNASRKVLFTEFRNLYDLRAIQPVLERYGYTYEEHLNYLINIQCSPEELLQNIGPRTRKHIRQALRKGIVQVEQVTKRSQLPVWYSLIRKTYHAARVPIANISLFESAFDILQPKGMIQFWLARIGEAYVAASAELVYKNVIYGWYGGLDRAYSNEMPGELLMWHVLEWGSLAGYEIYDFGGAGKPGEAYGVRDFKAKFKGDMVCFGRNTKVHSPGLLRCSELGYQIYRQLAWRI